MYNNLSEDNILILINPTMCLSQSDKGVKRGIIFVK